MGSGNPLARRTEFRRDMAERGEALARKMCSRGLRVLHRCQPKLGRFRLLALFLVRAAFGRGRRRARCPLLRLLGLLAAGAGRRAGWPGLLRRLLGLILRRLGLLRPP